MAIEAERLLAIFEARFTTLEKALTKARGDSAKVFGEIAASGTRAENALAAVGSRGTPGIDRMSKALGGARYQTANLAAQFQDIAVQLQAGQSPFTIALQQGTQISAALGSSGARGAVAALGGAFASLVNPVGLATVAVIALTGYAVQYFSTLTSSGEKSEEQLKAQAELIQRVADRWGEAAPAVKAYADALKRANELSQLRDATNIIIGEQFDKAEVALNRFSDALLRNDYGVAAQGLADLNDAINDLFVAQIALEKEFIAGGDTTEEYKRIQEILAGILTNSVVPAHGDLRDEVNKLAAAYSAVTTEAGKAAQASATVGGLPGKRGRIDPDALSDLDFAKRFAGAGEIPGKTGAGTSLQKESKRSQEAIETERQRKAVVDLIEDLQFERSIIGLTNVEREKAIALRRVEGAATEQQKLQIAGEIEDINAKTQALKALEDREKAVAAAGEYLSNTIESGLLGVTEGSLTAAEAVKKLGIELAIAAAKALLFNTGPLAALFGGSGAGAHLIQDVFDPGFASGGYTGPGGRNQPAGFVHKGEVVWNQQDVRRHGGPARVDAMRRGLAGYADGGIVTAGARSVRSGGSTSLKVIVNPAPNTEVESVRQRPDLSALEINMRAVARDEQRKNTKPVLQSGFGITPKVTRRV